jgi:hypothetical protein
LKALMYFSFLFFVGVALCNGTKSIGPVTHPRNVYKMC